MILTEAFERDEGEDKDWEVIRNEAIVQTVINSFIQRQHTNDIWEPVTPIHRIRETHC